MNFALEPVVGECFSKPGLGWVRGCKRRVALGLLLFQKWQIPALAGDPQPRALVCKEQGCSKPPTPPCWGCVVLQEWEFFLWFSGYANEGGCPKLLFFSSPPPFGDCKSVQLQQNGGWGLVFISSSFWPACSLSRISAKWCHVGPHCSSPVLSS